MATAGNARAVRNVTGETQQALVQAGVEALREVGFSGASAREIARRAGCHQSQVFYYFGSVVNLLLASLDAVSARRMVAYRALVEDSTTLVELIDAAETVVLTDLEARDVRVLVEMVSHAHTVDGLAVEVERRLEPWYELTELAVRRALARVPFGGLAPAEDVARGLVAGILGLELLEGLSGRRGGAAALFDRARAFAQLIERPAGPLKGRRA